MMRRQTQRYAQEQVKGKMKRCLRIVVSELARSAAARSKGSR